MILQALTQYYERKSASDPGSLPPFGFENKSIPVVVEIDEDGREVQVLTRDSKNGGAQELVPAPVKRTVGIAANLLWDSAEYCLGIDTRGKPQRVAEQHQAFLERVEKLNSQDEGIKALRCYLRYLNAEKRSSYLERYEEDFKENPNVSFRLLGDPHLICQRPEVIKAIREELTPDSENINLCLVSGTREPITKLHPPIKGVWGAQSSGANIVSFNLDAFNSYGKSQGYNSPVGERSSFSYTTALNHLLRKGSDQRIQAGDASTVFWSEKKASLEQNMSCIFVDVPDTNDPDRRSNAIKAIYNSVHRGRYQGPDADMKFYVLGLSPNASRIAIRFWQVATVGEISIHIKQYFDDLSMVHAQYEQEYLPLFFLLTSISVQNKSKNIPPNLAGGLMKSILSGTPYPYSFFAAAIRRNKAEQKVTYPRAAIIKACLNRFQKKQEIQMALDGNNPNPAYRLGRLFAVLEKAQEDANPGLNTTIRERYYGAASSSPVTVFSTLLKLKNHHVAKLPSGRKIYFEKLIGEIMSELPSSFATNLNLEDQGRFAVGYYHQRQDFFTPRKTSESGD